MRSVRNAVIGLAASLASAVSEPADADPPTVQEVIANVRRATGLDLLKKQSTGIMLSGSGQFLGNEVPASILLDASGRYVSRFEGPVPYAAAFNGKDAWSIEFGGVPRILAFDERSQQIIIAAAVSGSWLAPGAPFRFEIGPTPDEKTVALKFTYEDGIEHGVIEIDRPTWLPRKWTMEDGGSSRTLAFEGSREFAGMTFPVRITQQSAHGAASSIEIEKVSAAPTFIRSPFEPPPAAGNVKFDPAVPAALEVERALTGHLLVKPRVNGKEIGWFIFDTGAGTSCISSELHDELKLKQIGRVPALGIGGSVIAPVFRLDQFALGPATLQDSLIIELDFRFLEPHMGRKIAGVLGFEFISRCVTEIDLAAARIALHDPDAYKPDGVQWTPMRLSNRVPVVDASFEGHTHPMRLDTGAAGTVIFHRPFVEKLKLLEGRETTIETSGGVGGNVPTRAGKLKWFELGGQRLQDLDAGFVMESKGAFTDAYTAGVVGTLVLRRFTLVLDYPHQRIAFKKRSTGE